MSERSEAERIKGIALRSFRPGVLLDATFKNGGSMRSLVYVAPSDIPLSIFFRSYEAYDSGVLFLYSVHRWNGQK